MNDEHLKIQQSPENVENIHGPVPIPKIYPIDKCDETEDLELIYKSVQMATDYIRERSKISDTINYGIICGSGLHEISGIISDKVTIPFSEIPGMPSSLVQGHHNYVNIGSIGRQNVICFQGRCHYYEGHPMWKVSIPMRIIKCLGAELVFVTNSSGGMNPSYKVGDIMLIKDHVSIPCISGHNPLRGQNDARYGLRFPDMSDAYDGKFRKKCRKVINQLGLQDVFHEGIYCMSAGPSYETKAEIRMFRIIGGDAIGMSTAPEVITAIHSGLKVCGLTLISNMLDYEKYTGDEEGEEGGELNTSNGHNSQNGASNGHKILPGVNHEDVLAAASQMGKRISHIIQKMIAENDS